MKEQPSSRRHFLSFLSRHKKTPLATDFNLGTGGNKIKMLTADGKLVEVNQEAINNIGKKPKTKNADILKWRNTGKDKK
jgi:hypothetical protein